jgi:hypothetical protein
VCIGVELQRLRNARGLKPSQLARLAGHHSVARLLSEVNIAGGSHSLISAAPGSSGGPGEQLPRRAARVALPARPAQVALTQRAKLLLSLRATALGHDSPQQDAGPESSEVGRPVRPCLHSSSVTHGYGVPLVVLLLWTQKLAFMKALWTACRKQRWQKWLQRWQQHYGARALAMAQQRLPTPCWVCLPPWPTQAAEQQLSTSPH